MVSLNWHLSKMLARHVRRDSSEPCRTLKYSGLAVHSGIVSCSQRVSGALHAVTIRSLRRLANRSRRWNVEERNGAETPIGIRAVPPP